MSKVNTRPESEPVSITRIEDMRSATFGCSNRKAMSHSMGIVMETRMDSKPSPTIRLNMLYGAINERNIEKKENNRDRRESLLKRAKKKSTTMNSK